MACLGNFSCEGPKEKLARIPKGYLCRHECTCLASNGEYGGVIWAVDALQPEGTSGKLYVLYEVLSCKPVGALQREDVGEKEFVDWLRLSFPDSSPIACIMIMQQQWRRQGEKNPAAQRGGDGVSSGKNSATSFSFRPAEGRSYSAYPCGSARAGLRLRASVECAGLPAPGPRSGRRAAWSARLP
jgi:hypothetical protein